MTENFEDLELYEHEIKWLLGSELLATRILHCFFHFVLSTEFQISTCDWWKHCPRCQWNKGKHKLRCDIYPDGAQFPGRAV